MNIKDIKHDLVRNIKTYKDENKCKYSIKNSLMLYLCIKKTNFMHLKLLSI